MSRGEREKAGCSRDAVDTAYHSGVYAVVMLIVSVVIFALLLQFSTILAVGFFIAAIVTIPGLVIHRREAAYAPEIGPDAESRGRGWMRLARIVGVDMTGIALGVLLLLLLVLLVRQISGHHSGGIP